jgi:amino acid transporter
MATTAPASTGVQADKNLMKQVGFIGLIWASAGSIIGSGWLFGSLHAIQAAGTAAIASWLIGAAGLMVLAFVHAELGGMFPQAGGTARYPHYAFGSVTGASFGWFAWLQAAAVAPVEVLAVLSYGTVHIGWLTTTDASGNPVPTFPRGYLIAVALLAIFVVINFFGVRWLAHTNSTATWWKIGVPVLVIIVLIATHFHSANFGAHGGFAPYGLHGIFAATSSGAVIFALLGFEQAIQFGGESSNPQRDLPRAVIGSMIIGAIIYIMLQVAFIGALPGAQLAHGWVNVFTSGTLAAGPFASIATLAGLGWLATVLYIDALISPGGTGLIYTSSTARVSYGLSKNGYVPAIFEKTNTKGVPWFSLFFAFLASLVFFLPFPSWQDLVELVTDASLLMYAGAPLAFGVFRMHHNERPRAYRLPGGSFWSPIAFFIANMIIFWSGWTIVWKLGVCIAIGYVLIGINFAFKLNPRQPKLDWKAAQWVPAYILGLGIITYFGTYTGGRGDIKLGPDFAVMFAFSMVIYYWARAVALPKEESDAYIEAGSVEVVPESLQGLPEH